jgi:hypothetical protein
MLETMPCTSHQREGLLAIHHHEFYAALGGHETAS